MIRRATPADATLLAAIQESASLAALSKIFPPERYPYPRAAVLERWRSFDGWAAVAERDGEAAGFVAVEPPLLNGLYVVPAAWGSGVAAALHDAAVERLRADGVVEARLWVLEHNPRARRFYERRGWSPDGGTRELSFPPHPTDLRYVHRL